MDGTWREGKKGGYNRSSILHATFSRLPFFFRSRLSIYMVVVGGRRVQSSKSGKESFKEVGDRKTREKITGSRREIPQDEETKFAALVRSHREAEKRCKFEELQAASRKLEKRLYEEDEHLRANKERPGR